MPITQSLRISLFLACVAGLLTTCEIRAFAQTPAPSVGNPETVEATTAKGKKKKRAVTVKAKTTKPAETKVVPVVAMPVEVPKPAPVPQINAAAPAELLPQLADNTPPSKIAISSFVVEGDKPPPALVFQLQDGFVLGLVRAGVRVIDYDDLKDKLKKLPDLLGCDTSPCLKQLGQEVGVHYVVRVLVAITGNSYRMSARVFRTTGAAPAAVPVETLSRFCDVCTVTEAREAMLRLADGVRVPDEPSLATTDPTQLRQTEARPSKKSAMSAIALGLTSIIVGTITLASSGDRDKGLHALGGAFMGAGALTSVGGIYLYGEAVRPVPTAPAPVPVRPTAE
jgi:hypothetical protein